MQVIVINGFDDIFNGSCEDFYHYMKEDCGLSDFEFTLYKLYRKEKLFTKERLYRILNILFERYAGETIVLYYSGHGYRNGWQLNKHILVPYKKLFNIFKKHQKPFIFINDCCFAMAAKKYQKLLRNKNLILGLTPKSSIGFGSVLMQILISWSRRQPANPGYWNIKDEFKKNFMLRSGDELDYLCYPLKTRL